MQITETGILYTDSNQISPLHVN